MSEPIIPISELKVFFDGIFTEPRLQHPEGVAVDRGGNVWCGTETGRILRIDSEGREIAEVANTDGFILGLAFDARGALYACDLKHECVFRIEPMTGEMIRFADSGIHIPNVPVVDEARKCLYVSDSHAFDTPGPGIWRYELDDGSGGLWCEEDLTFANGLALRPDGSSIVVAETFARQIRSVAIAADGSAHPSEVLAKDLPGLPDGLAFDSSGNLYVCCYEPSRILRITPAGQVDIFMDDPTAHMLCHPTNCAFHGDVMYLANLGRWHITKCKVPVPGVRLPLEL